MVRRPLLAASSRLSCACWQPAMLAGDESSPTHVTQSETDLRRRTSGLSTEGNSEEALGEVLQ